MCKNYNRKSNIKFFGDVDISCFPIEEENGIERAGCVEEVGTDPIVESEPEVESTENVEDIEENVEVEPVDNETKTKNEPKEKKEKEIIYGVKVSKGINQTLIWKVLKKVCELKNEEVQTIWRILR